MSDIEDDIYLEHITEEQAVKAWRQAAFIMLNGGEYQPVGHDQLDGLAHHLLGTAHEWARETVKGWKSDG